MTRRPPPSSLLLHQYEQGELTEDEHEAVRLAIAADPEVRRRWQAVRAAESGFAVQSLPPWLLDEARPSRPWWRTWLPVLGPVGGLVAVGAAVLLVLGTPGLLDDPGPDTVASDTLRSKGELPALEVWVAGEAGARPLREGEALSEGSHVQLVFDARGRRFATLAGRDGTGTVEIYDTVDVGGQQGLVEAPFGLQLDGAPGPQAFFVVVHEERLARAALVEAVEAGGDDVTSIIVDKE